MSTLNWYQDETGTTAVHPQGSQLESLTYLILALNGEAGELANKLKKNLRAGSPVDPVELADELGDCFWYVARIAHALGFSLYAIAVMNLKKLAKRRAANEIVNHG